VDSRRGGRTGAVGKEDQEVSTREYFGVVLRVERRRRGREGRREGCRSLCLARRGRGGKGGGGGGNFAVVTLSLSSAFPLVQFSLFRFLRPLLPFLLLNLLLLPLALFLLWQHIPDVKFPDAFVVIGGGATE